MCSRAMTAISSSGSTAPVLTVPALATTASGVFPAIVSSAIAARSESALIRKRASTGMSRRFSRPSPSSATDFGNGHVYLTRCIDDRRPSTRLVRRAPRFTRHCQPHQVRRGATTAEASREPVAAEFTAETVDQGSLDRRRGGRGSPGRDVLVQRGCKELSENADGFRRSHDVTEEPSILGARVLEQLVEDECILAESVSGNIGEEIVQLGPAAFGRTSVDEIDGQPTAASTCSIGYRSSVQSDQVTQTPRSCTSSASRTTGSLRCSMAKPRSSLAESSSSERTADRSCHMRA